MQSQEYLTHPGLRQSQLKHILNGVEEFKYHLDNPSESTDSQNLGSAVHLLVLEPQKSNRLVCMPKHDLNSRLGKILTFLKEGKSFTYFPIAKGKTKKQEKGLFYEVESEEFDFIHEMIATYEKVFLNPSDYLILSQDDYNKAEAMAEAFYRNTDAYCIIGNSIAREENYYFTYRDIIFKCQVDIRGKFDSAFVCDLKTTITKNNLKLLKYEIENNLYHFQAAPYMIATGADRYFIIFVRNVAPYAVFPIELSGAMIAQGRALFDEACSIYNDALKNNPAFKPQNRMRMI